MHRATVRSLAVVVAALSVAVAGCGVTDGSADGGAVSAALGSPLTARQVEEAAETTAAVSSEKVWVEVRTTDAAGDEVATITAEGAFDAEALQGQLLTRLDGGSGMLADLVELEVVYDGDTAYVRSAAMEMFTDGKPWLKVQADELVDAASSFGGSLQSDPGAFLDLLTEVGGPVEELGDEVVRGVPTRHIATEVVPAEALASLEGERADQLREKLDDLGSTLDDVAPIPVEAWIDADGYVRRLVVTIDLGELTDADAEGAGATVTQTIELYDFDEPVDIELPPADQVSELDLSDVFGD